MHQMKADHSDTNPQEETYFEEKNLVPHLIVSKDDKVSANVEVTEEPLNEKCKLPPNEKVLFPETDSLKHRIEPITSSSSENDKEFKNCVGSDNIIDKIKSFVEDVTCNNISKGMGQYKRFITSEEATVADRKCCEYDKDILNLPKNLASLYPYNQWKNKECYKRYREHLTVTRDWSSNRKTYSRKRDSIASSDSSSFLLSQNESFKDVHQLSDTTEHSTISINTSELEGTPPKLPASDIVKAEKTDELKILPAFFAVPNPEIREYNPVLSNEQTLVKQSSSPERSNIPESRTCEEQTFDGRASLEDFVPNRTTKFQNCRRDDVKLPGVEQKPLEETMIFDILVDTLKAEQEDTETSIYGNAATDSKTNLSFVKVEFDKQPKEEVEMATSRKRKRESNSAPVKIIEPETNSL